jgi:sugar lactone lactonase YvrE
MKIEGVLESGDIVGEGPVWRREQECIYWTDTNGFKISREKAARAMERLLACTSRDFQLSIHRQPADETQARHRKKRKEMVQE